MVQNMVKNFSYNYRKSRLLRYRSKHTFTPKQSSESNYQDNNNNRRETDEREIY